MTSGNSPSLACTALTHIVRYRVGIANSFELGFVQWLFGNILLICLCLTTANTHQPAWSRPHLEGQEVACRHWISQRSHTTLSIPLIFSYYVTHSLRQLMRLYYMVHWPLLAYRMVTLTPSPTLRSACHPSRLTPVHSLSLYLRLSSAGQSLYQFNLISNECNQFEPMIYNGPISSGEPTENDKWLIHSMISLEQMGHPNTFDPPTNYFPGIAFPAHSERLCC